MINTDMGRLILWPGVRKEAEAISVVNQEDPKAGDRLRLGEFRRLGSRRLGNS